MPSPATQDPMKVSIVPASGSNALILTGIAPDLDAVEKLIDPLDKNGTADTAQVKTVQLKHARAETLARKKALDAVLAGKPTSELQVASIGCNIKWKPGNEPAY